MNHGCDVSVLVGRLCKSQKDALASLMGNVYPEERREGVVRYSLLQPCSPRQTRSNVNKKTSKVISVK
jgi:hypothetical protein